MSTFALLSGNPQVVPFGSRRSGAARNIDVSDVHTLCLIKVRQLSDDCGVSEAQADSALQLSKWNVNDAANLIFDCASGATSSAEVPPGAQVFELRAEEDDLAAKLLPSADPHSCILCYSTKCYGDSVKTECGSILCTECCRSYICDKITFGTSNVPCPVTNCNALLSFRLIATVLSASGPPSETTSKNSSLPFDQGYAQTFQDDYCSKEVPAKGKEHSSPSDMSSELAQTLSRPPPSFLPGVKDSAQGFVTSEKHDISLQLVPETTPGSLNRAGCGGLGNLKTRYVELLILYRLRRVLGYVSESLNLSQCPNEQCEGIIERFDTDQVCIECSLCESPFCWDCGAEYHWPLDCASSGMWSKVGRRKIDDMLSEQWILTHTRLCPQCAVPTVKGGGCDQVTCTLCETEWNWREPDFPPEGYCGEESHKTGNPDDNKWTEYGQIRVRTLLTTQLRAIRLNLPLDRNLSASEHHGSLLSYLNEDKLSRMRANGEACSADAETVSLVLRQIKSAHRELKWIYLCMALIVHEVAFTTRNEVLRIHLEDIERAVLELTGLLESIGGGEGKRREIQKLSRRLETLRKPIGELCSELCATCE